jgi:DUF1365 family protein
VNSALYSGWIAHRRFAPKAHAFRYRIGLLYLDLANRTPCSACRRRPQPFGAVFFRQPDYLRELTGTACA